MRHLQTLCGLVLFSCTQALVFPNLRAQECQTASVCNGTICEELGEANCHCSGNETKFGLEDRPQIVYLTFDDAFTAVSCSMVPTRTRITVVSEQLISSPSPTQTMSW